MLTVLGRGDEALRRCHPPRVAQGGSGFVVLAIVAANAAAGRTETSASRQCSCQICSAVELVWGATAPRHVRPKAGRSGKRAWRIQANFDFGTGAANLRTLAEDRRIDGPGHTDPQLLTSVQQPQSVQRPHRIRWRKRPRQLLCQGYGSPQYGLDLSVLGYGTPGCAALRDDACVSGIHASSPPRWPLRRLSGKPVRSAVHCLRSAARARTQGRLRRCGSDRVSNSAVARRATRSDSKPVRFSPIAAPANWMPTWIDSKRVG